MEQIDIRATDPQNLVMIITDPEDKGRAIVKHYILRDTVLYDNEMLAILAAAANGPAPGEPDAGGETKAAPESPKKTKQE